LKNCGRWFRQKLPLTEQNSCYLYHYMYLPKCLIL